MSKSKMQSYATVWEALADTPEEAANLRVRSELMRRVASRLAALIEINRWTQTEAARCCGVTQPRINDLLRGRISRFSIDGLVNIAAALGLTVNVKLSGTVALASRRNKFAGQASKRRRHRALAGGNRASGATTR